MQMYYCASKWIWILDLYYVFYPRHLFNLKYFIFLTREGVCDRKPNCDPKSKYRTFDGTCNNLKVTNHGKSSFLIENILRGLYS